MAERIDNAGKMIRKPNLSILDRFGFLSLSVRCLILKIKKKEMKIRSTYLLVVCSFIVGLFTIIPNQT